MAGSEDAARAADETQQAAAPEQQQQQQQQQQSEEEAERPGETVARAEGEQPSGFVAETQTQSQENQSPRADELAGRKGEKEEGPTQSLNQEEEADPARLGEEKQEEKQQQEQTTKSPSAAEEPPRFEPPSPPRGLQQQQQASETERMSAPPRSSRYSYTELKEAQRRCEGKMVDTALLECRDASRAQQEIFRAHVTDLCANIFAAALRKYNPESKEDLEPVDPAISAKVAEVEQRLKAKEAAVHELRKQVPRLAAMSTRQQLASERKRNADVLVTAPEVTDEVEMADVDVEAMRDAFVKTSTTIANANAKLSQVITQTTETIHVVEQAMKRPKTSIDKAMEHSPLKSTVLLTDQEMASDEHPSSMRTRLAMHFSASKSV